MILVRKRKLYTLAFILVVLSLVTALVMYALRQNINLFYTPTDIVLGKAPLSHPIRAGGMVKKGSFIRENKSLKVRFEITDFNQEIQVSHEGILPDLFREGQGVVVEGMLSDNNHLKASRVLAKHDENYMPPEVKAALKRNNS